MISYVFFLHFQRSLNLKGKPILHKSAIFIILALVTIGGFLICIAVIKELVMNSTIPLTLQNISNLTIYSIIGFIIIAAVFVSYLLIFFRLSGFYSVRNFGIAIVLMAIVATFFLNHYNDHIEKEKRKLLSVRLSIEGDPMVEMLFSRIENDLLNDPVIKNNNPQGQSGLSNLKDDSIASLLLKKYFRESWNNFMVQITICRPDKFLRIQPQNYQVNCETYFQDLIRDFAKPASCNHLFYLDYGYGMKNYLAVIPFGSIENPDNLKKTRR